MTPNARGGMVVRLLELVTDDEFEAYVNAYEYAHYLELAGLDL